MGDDTTRPCVRCGAADAATLRLVSEEEAAAAQRESLRRWIEQVTGKARS